ncbi:hypothetical protein [Conexibacter arvalis]|uniref:Uncharacterized protein n=1 Tax=Conexibacter arvalis TaxID=912552 RepID=A0A840ID77_9ACTN|nr:hypothetical protein [Conexibacter arvalis]MBB4662201.1 hypothetical protein [Conexibacter arvalis]
MKNSWIFRAQDSMKKVLRRCVAGTVWGGVIGAALDAGRQLLARTDALKRNARRIRKIATVSGPNAARKRQHYLKRMFRDLNGVMKAARSISTFGVFTRV